MVKMANVMYVGIFYHNRKMNVFYDLTKNGINKTLNQRKTSKEMGADYWKVAKIRVIFRENTYTRRWRNYLRPKEKEKQGKNWILIIARTLVTVEKKRTPPSLKNILDALT